jgi:hydrogenase-1 operon protein HyaF
MPDTDSMATTLLAAGLLREIADALSAFSRTGTAVAIDLRSLPLSDADLTSLDAALGRGAVEAVVTAGGESEIWETSYSGVWWVRDFDGSGRVVAERIEVTAIPGMLPSHSADVAVAAARLRDAMAPAPSLSTASTAEETLNGL